MSIVLRTKCYKTKKNIHIYIKVQIYNLQRPFFHSISVKDLFPLQIFIDTLFILMYSMIRCFYYFLVDYNNNIRCTMILHIFLLFSCKYYFYYFDPVCVPHSTEDYDDKMTFLLICIICCEFLKCNGFRYIFVHGYE